MSCQTDTEQVIIIIYQMQTKIIKRWTKLTSFQFQAHLKLFFMYINVMNYSILDRYIVHNCVYNFLGLVRVRWMSTV